MTIFKRIEIDLEAERKRINRAGTYNNRQKKVLLKLVDLFEKGEWQKCLYFVNDKRNFPDNEERGYSEKEHIGLDVADILHDVAYNNYYTRDEIMDEAREIIKKENKK